MSDNFADLFEKSLATTNMQEGAILRARVIALSDDYVTVSAGLKSEGVIPIDEFFNDEGELTVKVGDVVDVALDNVEDGFGETILSRRKAKHAETWTELERAHEAGEIVRGLISDKVKGGFTVEIKNVKAFLPGSLVDIRPVRDTGYLEGKELEFKVIKMDRKRNNIVVSRRAVVQAENGEERDALLESLQEGKEVTGVVKNLTDYGAFVDLGGVDGLLHITDISWKRVKHPSEVLKVGEEVRVKVLRFDRDKNRVSLGMKQLGDDPWLDITRRYPEKARLFGKVTNITDYGCFVEIESGVEGLVHMSEMDWTNKNIHPSKVVSLGDEVEVMVLEIDEERRRISLGMKQCQANPWDTFSQAHKKGDKISGRIRSITDFGIFIGLDGDIDGLIHLSDISWNEPGETAVRNYKKGQDVSAIILGIDSERERISLGIKQLESDPFTNYVDLNAKGSIVTGKVTEVDAKGNATVELAEEVIATLAAKEMADEKIAVGDSVEAKIVNIDKKTRAISLSVKAKDVQQEADAIRQYKQTTADDIGSGTTLGDLLKEKMDNNKSE